MAVSPLIILAILSAGLPQGWEWEEPLSTGGPIVRVTVRPVESRSNWHYSIHLKSAEGLDQTIDLRSGQALGRADIRLVDLNADGFLDLMVAGGKDHRGQAWFKTWLYRPRAKAFRWIGSLGAGSSGTTYNARLSPPPSVQNVRPRTDARLRDRY